MRKLSALFLALAFLGLDAGLATAQEAAHPTVALTGCLAQADDDDAAGFVLEGVDDEAISSDWVALTAADGVNLAPHVGHTVEATGMMIEGGMGDDMGDAGDEHPDVDAVDDDSYVYVTSLSHIAASCEGD